MITKDWQERFRLLSSDQYTIVLEQVVSRYEPPQTLTALQNCVQQAKRDRAIANVETLSEQKTTQLGTHMGLVASTERSKARSYPIYYRLCERHVSDVSSKLRAHFHTVLRHCEQRSATRFSIDVQYEDILAIDFCLREVSRSLSPPDDTAVLDALTQAVRQAVPAYTRRLVQQRDALRISASPDTTQFEKAERKVDRAESLFHRALEILEDGRALGELKRDSGDQRRNSQGSAGQGFDSARAPSLFPKLDDRLPKVNIHEAEKPLGHEGEAEQRFPYRKPFTGDEHRDARGPKVKIRHLVPYSGRLAQQLQERTDRTSLQNDTVVSASDYHRLSPNTLARAFFWLYHAGDGAFVFGWLIATTGMPIDRMQSTKVSASLPKGWEPHYDPESGILRYRILDGAAPVTNGENRVVALHLPPPLPRLIAGIIAQLASAQVSDPLPFAEARKTASAQLHYRFQDMPGPPVTLRALRAGALEWLLPESRDEVEALLTTGQLGNYHGAADAYRSSELDEINEVYRATSHNLAGHVQKKEPGVRFTYEMLRAAPPAPGRNYAIGSRRSIDADQWRALFENIRSRAVTAGLAVDAAPSVSEEKLKCCIDLYQHAAAYAFLGWSLGTAARPTSSRSTILLTEDLAFVADKATKAHFERRELPMVSLVNRQIAHACALFRHVVDLAEKLGSVGIHLHHQPDRIQLPPWVHWSRFGLRAQDTRMDLLKQWSADHGYTLHRWPINAARHSAVAMLRDQVPTVVLDALLGHARGSRDAFSTWSGLALGEVFAELRPAIKEMLALAGYQPLKVGDYAEP
ncbi:UNVERIFIED_CONTAM: hypothetical protein K0B97_08890 [Spiribacter pallidus]